MLRSANFLRAMVAGVALSILAGCAAMGPQLGGAWYQVYFSTNSFQIDAKGQSIVQNVASVVANNPSSRVTVIGKTDRVGSAPDNMALSHRRADAVRNALIGAGVSANRIDTTWTGEARQDVATANDVADQRNRVVNLTVVK